MLERSQAERQKLLRDLEAASRAKDEFLAMLGHELRNPLSPIVTALQLMKLRGDPRISREQQVIERQVNHLIRLVDDLLDVSKITRGKVELRKERVEIADVIAKAVEMASPLLEQRSHRARSTSARRAACAVDGRPGAAGAGGGRTCSPTPPATPTRRSGAHRADGGEREATRS